MCELVCEPSDPTAARTGPDLALAVASCSCVPHCCDPCVHTNDMIWDYNAGDSDPIRSDRIGSECVCDDDF